MAADTEASAPTAEPQPRFEVLQSCRGFLAISVVVYHLTATTHFYDYVKNAYVAVDFFFVLSGFVIASAYGRRIGSAMLLAQYVVRRVGRLYPLHLFMLAVWLAIEFGKLWLDNPPYFTGETSWPAFWANLTLTHGFNRFSNTWNYPSWSISIEFWANIVAGLVLLACGRRARLGVLAVIAALAVFFFSRDWIDYGALRPEIDILANDADYAIGFFLGMLTFGAFQQLRRLRLGAVWGLDLVALMLVVGVFRFADDMPALSKSFVFAVVVLIFAFEKGALSWLLRRRACLRLGTISYSIYLTHAVYVGLFTEAIYAAGDRLNQAVTTPIDGVDVIVLGGPWVLDAVSLVLVAVVIVSSDITYRLIEDPARRLFNRMSRGWGATG